MFSRVNVMGVFRGVLGVKPPNKSMAVVNVKQCIKISPKSMDTFEIQNPPNISLAMPLLITVWGSAVVAGW